MKLVRKDRNGNSLLHKKMLAIFGWRENRRAMIEVLPVRTARERKRFLNFAAEIYRDIPAWVPPLQMDVLSQIDPDKGDFFKHSTGEFFMAWREGKPLGRIAALHNTRHIDAHADGAGFFGFFECEDNPTTAKALLDTAEKWLRAQGLAVARGPANFSVQDEAGVLIDGFEHTPMSGMGYTTPYYRGLLEAAGYTKAKDLYVFRITRETWKSDQFDRMCAVADRVAAGVTLRSLNMKDLPAEAARMELIFAEAWRDNWGAQPISQAEFLKYAHDFRLFINPELIVFAERDDEPLGMVVAIPNMNKIIQRIGGRMLPFCWWTLLTQRKRVTGVLLFLMGLRKSARRLGLPILLIRAIHNVLIKYQHPGELEFSWILEDNHETIALIKRVGGYQVQTLRIYDKTL